MATSQLNTTGVVFYSDNAGTRSSSLDSTASDTLKVTAANNSDAGNLEVTRLNLPQSNFITASDASRIEFGTTGSTTLVTRGLLNNTFDLHIDSSQSVNLGAFTYGGTINIGTGGTNSRTINIGTANSSTARTITIGNGSSTSYVVSTNNYQVDTSGNVTATSFVISSDEQLKQNIEVMPSALEKLEQIRGVQFQWKANGASDVGVIAQEVEEVLPEAVSMGADGYRKVDYMRLVPLLIQSIREQNAVIKRQGEEIAELRAKCL